MCSSDLAAEHIAANALYQIEVNGVKAVKFDAQMVEELLGLNRILNYNNDKI